MVSRILLLNKPFGVVCQFRPAQGRSTLKDYVATPSIYPLGRLDADSEGLVLLSANGLLQHSISAPTHGVQKRYWVQVEGIPGPDALAQLHTGIDIGDYFTRPAEAIVIPEPHDLWPRDPPIRVRARIPTSWLEIVLSEGKNRQIRRMTARVGHPTLRLIRHAIGPWSVLGLRPGESRWYTDARVARLQHSGRDIDPRDTSRPHY